MPTIGAPGGKAKQASTATPTKRITTECFRPTFAIFLDHFYMGSGGFVFVCACLVWRVGANKTKRETSGDSSDEHLIMCQCLYFRITFLGRDERGSPEDKRGQNTEIWWTGILPADASADVSFFFLMCLCMYVCVRVRVY